MATQQLHQLAQIKLRELSRQQRRLTARYDELEAAARSEQTPLPARLDALLAGLASLSFAQTPLHPTADEIRQQTEVLRLEATYGQGDHELLQRSLDRLLDELARGRTRVTFAHVFGLLIEEHLETSGLRATPLPPGEEHEELLQPPPARPRSAALLGQIFASRARAFEPLRDRLAERKLPLVKRPSAGYVHTLLGRIVRGHLTSPSLREAAAAAHGSAAIEGELADVLAIMLDHLDEWDWPERGISLWLEEEHGKTRISLDEGLLDALLLAHVGSAWLSAFLPWRDQVGRISSDESPHLFRLPPPPVLPDAPNTDELRRFHHDSVRRLLDERLVQQNHALAQGLNDLDNSYTPRTLTQWSTQDQLLNSVHSHLTACHAHDPAQEQWVLQFDLKDFFPSIDHTVLLDCLQQLGAAPRWLRFVERYLAVPVATPSGPHRLKRGLPASRSLSWVFSELLLLPLEIAVFDATGLVMLRAIDDCVVIAPGREQLVQAWSIVRSFVEQLGLALNPEKCGAVCVLPGSAPRANGDGLPTTRPRWGALRLAHDGSWQVDQPRLEALRTWTARKFASAASTLQASASYSTEMLYLARTLGLSVRLGEGHLERIASILAETHQHLAAPGRGASELLKARAAELEGTTTGPAIPSPLLYWPVTAGGLGLLQPMILVQGLQQSHQSTIKPPEPPPLKEWQELAAEWQPGSPRKSLKEMEQRLAPMFKRWTSYFEELNTPPFMHNPEESAALKPLIADFIRRGTELGEREQSSLSPYWRRVIHTYGPPLLDAVGTFRFLPAELVPLPLLFGQKIAPPKTPIEVSTSDDDVPF